jgi:histidyl-tRNA synthetase
MRLVHDAEIIKVLADFLREYSTQIGPWQINLSHAKLITHIFDLCEIDRRKHREVMTVLEHLWKTSWPGIAKHLTKNCGLTQKTVDTLEPFCKVRGPLEQIVPRLHRQLITNNKEQKAIAEALADLQKMVLFLRAFGVLEKVQFHLGLVLNQPGYDGIIFQATLLNKANTSTIDIVAAGGRYDKLITEFQTTTITTSPVAAVGINIAIEKIIFYVSNFEKEQCRHEKRSLKATETEVVICALGQAGIIDGMQIANLLWARQIRAEYLHSDSLSSMDELHLQCKQTGVKWMVIIKNPLPLGNVPVKSLVKMKNVDTNAEVAVAVKDLADFLFPLLHPKPKESPLGGDSSSISAESTPPVAKAGQLSSPVLPSLNTIVLDQDMRSKKKKQISLGKRKDFLVFLFFFLFPFFLVVLSPHYIGFLSPNLLLFPSFASATFYKLGSLPFLSLRSCCYPTFLPLFCHSRRSKSFVSCD